MGFIHAVFLLLAFINCS